jgi:predicted DNA-binding transcriptional regulator AlpA
LETSTSTFPEHVTTREAARLAGVSGETLLHWLHLGRPGMPRPIRFNPRNYRWPRAEFLTWLDSLRPQEGPAGA